MGNQLKNQKDQLARLMATENLTIVHKKVPTAYFDMKNRILCCPIFKDDLSKELYDLFMGHEVGHALNTPYEGVHSALTKNKTLKGYLNVVEDVRIEKAIKIKYAGLKRSFFTAYNELMEMDFFGIKTRNLDELSLIDKINLITKVGHRVNITLSDEEQGFLDMAEACKTWDEVEICANAIYDWSKENEVRDETDEALVPQTVVDMPDMDMDDEDDEYGDNDFGDPDSDDDGEPGDGDDSDDDDSDEDATGTSSDEGDDSDEDSLPDSTPTDKDADEDTDGEKTPEEDRKVTGREGGVGTNDDYDDSKGARESITEHAAHNNEDQFLSEENIIQTTIMLKEKFKDRKNFKNMVLPYKQMIEDFTVDFWEMDSDKHGDYNDSPEKIAKRLARATHSSKKLKEKNKKIVAHMAKEFEMKQTAQRSAKAFQGKTGQLDMNRLAKYQIVDDIFKKVTYLPDGKNHGLNILLDWSGSISGEVSDLLEQSLILVDFCRKVNIPHRLYLFSDVYGDDRSYEERQFDGPRLIELFSDKMSTREFNKNHINVSHIFNNYFLNMRSYKGFDNAVVQYNDWYAGCDEITDVDRWYDFDDHSLPRSYRLGGTPLDAAIVAMRCLLPEFNTEYGIEKSILTIITDGYSHSADILSKSDEEHDDVQEQAGTESSWRCTQKRTLIDPFSNKAYDYSTNAYNRGDQSFTQTQNLLDWVSNETRCIVTGYFCLSRKGDLWDLSRNLPSMDVDVNWRQIRKEGIAVKVHGYNKLFLTCSNTLSVAGDDELSDDLAGAGKRKLMSAFKKNQKSKTTSRFLTNEFIKEIA